jgi:protein-ribulosamine 3-kinase
MNENDIWVTISHQVESARGAPFTIARRAPAGGGCINAAQIIEGVDGSRYFVKLNGAAHAEMFAAEYEGLLEIAGTTAIRVPDPLCHGVAGGRAYLVLEYLELGRGTSASAAQLGRDLAAMHRHTRKAYGWHRDNTIGTTPQPNGELPDWTGFWRERRLGFQLELAARAGYPRLAQLGERLLDALPTLFVDHQPAASLLHGDLWSGNQACLTDGTPVIYDVAVYYGDRETDIAMSELFGRFPEAFYAAYREAWPLPAGYALRREVYNLYHILNHLNLFGSSYLAEAEDMIRRILAHVR